MRSFDSLRFSILVLGGLVGIACGPDGSASESGYVESCGDNVKSPDELCDDGNLIAGDGCSPDCIPSGSALECVTLLTGSDRNEISDLLPIADGAFLAAGSVYLDGAYQGWVGRFTGEGPTWIEEITFPNTPVVTVVDLAADGFDGAWALVSGNQLLHFDAAGSIVATVSLADATDLDVTTHAIESTDAGLWLSGASEGDAWLGLYDPKTNEIENLLIEDFDGHDDEIHAVSRGSTEVAVAVTVSTSPNSDGDIPLVATTDIVVIHFDLQGHELRRTLLSPEPDPASARRALGISSDTAGRWFVGGVHVPQSTFVFSHIWLAEVDASSSWHWTSEGLADAAEFGSVLGVDDGVLSVAGWYGLAAPAEAAWSASFDANGTLRWESNQEALEGYERHLHRVAIIDSDGQTRIASKFWTPGESSLLRSCLITQ